LVDDTVKMARATAQDPHGGLPAAQMRTMLDESARSARAK